MLNMTQPYKPQPDTQHPSLTKQEESVAATPSGVRGDNPATAGPGPTEVTSNTPENREGHLNPSAPEDSNITPGSAPPK